MALHALELTLDAASDAAVRADWAALVGAGLPSQARHRGVTNAPHVTLVSAPHLPAEAVAAARRWGERLPVLFTLAGFALFGRGPYTLARLLSADAATTAAVHELRGLVPDAHPDTWVPHVTLARKVAAPDVPATLAALAAPTPDVTAGAPVVGAATEPRDTATRGHVRAHVAAATVRQWDPDTRQVLTLAGPVG